MKLESIRKLPANTQGKDYIVGDLHGCYVLLERLLAEVKFDPVQDRLFSVGDLVDRGPDSLRCLQLLDEPWFYAVMGNRYWNASCLIWRPESWQARMKSPIPTA